MNNEIYLQPEQVLEMEPIMGFKPHMDSMSGTVEWVSDDLDLFVYATPNWEDEGRCPIEYYDGDDNHTYVGSISFTGRDIETQKKEYREIVTQIIQGFKEGW
jgi:hypothetical protein